VLKREVNATIAGSRLSASTVSFRNGQREAENFLAGGKPLFLRVPAQVLQFLRRQPLK